MPVPCHAATVASRQALAARRSRRPSDPGTSSGTAPCCARRSIAAAAAAAVILASKVELRLRAVVFASEAAASRSRHWRHSRCYLLDYVCYKPADDRKVSTVAMKALIDRSKRLDAPARSSLLRVTLRSGLGEHTYAPLTVMAGREDRPTHQHCVNEMDAFFHDDAVAELFARTKLGPRDMDVLVVNVGTARVPDRARRRRGVQPLRHGVQLRTRGRGPRPERPARAVPAAGAGAGGLRGVHRAQLLHGEGSAAAAWRCCAGSIVPGRLLGARSFRTLQ
ncbi:hypothetical protein U9M48_016604 [Paspalum notatum var. saurae]|uniref:FAE domain-containing protein n=1 Tax=Paspalum notatum var. saurae TaxID=547442 RepID=A0AAQ3T6R9_PASNO